MEPVRIGIIGGSGLYRMEGLADTREYVAGSHTLIPSQIPFRANIYAMKAVGVQYLLSVSAVVSLREEIAPLHRVLPDQFIDLTRKREGSFFGDGAVAHVSLADPVCGVIWVSGITCRRPALARCRARARRCNWNPGPRCSRSNGRPRGWAGPPAGRP